ncbi:MAG: hypothetical protein KBT27_09425 [Prevotellaceae bacterium]|nr:hypothetical protein [Candidatus Faecinaster equi]
MNRKVLQSAVWIVIMSFILQNFVVSTTMEVKMIISVAMAIACLMPIWADEIGTKKDKKGVEKKES